MNQSIKNIIMNEKGMSRKVYFDHYSDNELWYITETGFNFPVPISDTGTGVFAKEDKALLFMRWIRKHIEMITKAKEDKAANRELYLKDVSDYLKGCHDQTNNTGGPGRSPRSIRRKNT